MRKLDTTGNHRAHSVNIEAAGREMRNKTGTVLSGLFNLEVQQILFPSDKIGIYTTGSDGRGENKAHPGCRSNLEVQIITDANISSADVGKLVTHIKNRVPFNIENSEHKRLGVDSMSLYKNDSNLVFPTRIFDSKAFFDPNNFRSLALRQVSREIMQDPKLPSKMYDRFRGHKKTMETGVEKFHHDEHTAFDLNEGKFIYDPNAHILGVKSGPLRYVQYLLAVALMRYIRDTKTHPIFLDTLPTNIVERLEFIRDGSLSKKNDIELSRLSEIYEFFLHLYHEMQYRHFSENETEFIVEDRDTLRDIRDMLDCLRDAYHIDQFYPVNIKNNFYS